jgi:Icc-related predicted phosphoesterase
VTLAEERLRGSGIRCYITGGNDDFSDVLAVLLSDGAGALRACEGEVLPIDGRHTMASLGISTPTPWHTPREVTEDELGTLIEELVSRVPDPSHCIFNFHDPPNDSTLDTCPMLDWTTDPPSQITRGGSIVLHGAGSRSVRHAIETTSRWPPCTATFTSRAGDRIGGPCASIPAANMPKASCAAVCSTWRTAPSAAIS